MAKKKAAVAAVETDAAPETSPAYLNHILPELRHMAVRVEDLMLDPVNARKHGIENLAAIRGSLTQFGQRMPIVVQKQGMIVRAGNGRVMVARELGWSHIAAVVVDESNVDAVMFALTDNRTADLAEWDEGILGQLLRGMETSNDDLAQMFADLQASIPADMLGDASGQTEPDEIPDPPVEAVTQPGDTWLLGKHRLLCGDGRKPDDVDWLLQGVVPFMMVTDPPYGFDYDPEWRVRDGLNSTGRNGKVQNDTIADWTPVWRLFPGSVVYVWHGALAGATVQTSLAHSGFFVRAQIVWVKPSLVISRGHYHWRHEPAYAGNRDGEELTIEPDGVVMDGEKLAEQAWYGVRKGATAYWRGNRKQSTVWEVGFTGEVKTEHSTQKPVECMARPMRNHGGFGDAVYDPFCGSGTTLIAAEMTGRTCYAMEIDPVYCDVAVARWERFTGRKAERIPAEDTPV